MPPKPVPSVYKNKPGGDLKCFSVEPFSAQGVSNGLTGDAWACAYPVVGDTPNDTARGLAGGLMAWPSHGLESPSLKVHWINSEVGYAEDNGPLQCFDAYGRRVTCDGQAVINDWTFMGAKPPLASLPCVQPTPIPSPTPVPSPEPPPITTPGVCPKPDGVKIGFRGSVQKDRGFRNTFDITPTYHGAAIKPETGCGPELVEKYGPFEGFQTSNAWAGRDPVEFQSDNAYIMVDATNSDDEHWSGGRFTLAGTRTYCVSYAHLSFWRCQNGHMTDAGQLVGFGKNEQGYDLPKR